MRIGFRYATFPDRDVFDFDAVDLFGGWCRIRRGRFDFGT